LKGIHLRQFQVHSSSSTNACDLNLGMCTFSSFVCLMLSAYCSGLQICDTMWRLIG
jgi:hypothetical protein